MGALAGPLGEARAFDALVMGTVWLNMLSAWALARRVWGDAWAATLAGLGVGLAPVVLSYCVMGAITDMLHLWPWLLALVALHAAWVAPADAPTRALVLRGASAGALAALGFALSPYNLVLALGGGVPGALLALGWALRDPARRPALVRSAPRALGGALLAGGLLAGPWALALRGIMDDPASTMSSAYVDATRHAPPWREVRPNHPAGYAARLEEYVATAPGDLLARDVGSHYARTTAVPWVLIALGCAGALLLRGTGAGRWLAVAGFAAVASTGPYLSVSETIYLTQPVNPAYRVVYHLLGGRMILEVFRYGVVAAVAAALAAAATVAALRARGGAWRATGPVACALLLAQLCGASPVPWPLPHATPTVSSAYAQLDAALGPGAILELPYFDRGTGRFARVHFLNQRVHGRPIADEVRGFPPRLLLQNPFTVNLLAAEGATGLIRIDKRPEGREDAGRRALAEAGFAGVVVDPAGYATPEALAEVERILGPRYTTVGDRRVWRLR